MRTEQWPPDSPCYKCGKPIGEPFTAALIPIRPVCAVCAYKNIMAALDEDDEPEEWELNMLHIDDWIGDEKNDEYARGWFEKFRRPEIDKLKDPDARLLFCTYEERRWRVMGCSRLGDVWLHGVDHKGDYGYAKRVDVAECSEWSATP